MASNPLIAQGTLNRLRGSVVVTNIPNLTVTAPYLGKTGISLALQGVATTYIDTMTGSVTAPEPYQLVTVVISTLKTNGIASLWKAQMENTTLLGDIVVSSDTLAFPSYKLVNCAIESIADMAFNGTTAEVAITVKGIYNINNNLWNLV